MARKSKRKLERLLDDLKEAGDAGDSDLPFDSREGVTAEFVTYGDGSPEPDAPEGWAVATQEGREGAVYHVLRQESGEEGKA